MRSALRRVFSAAMWRQVEASWWKMVWSTKAVDVVELVDAEEEEVVEVAVALDAEEESTIEEVDEDRDDPWKVEDTVVDAERCGVCGGAEAGRAEGGCAARICVAGFEERDRERLSSMWPLFMLALVPSLDLSEDMMTLRTLPFKIWRPILTKTQESALAYPPSISNQLDHLPIIQNAIARAA